MSTVDALAALNQSVRIKIYDNYVGPEWQNGLNFMEENSEILLTLVDTIITDHHPMDENEAVDSQIRSVTVQKGVLHDKKVNYNSNSLI